MLKICLGVLSRGSIRLKRGDYASAERTLRAALLVMRAIPTAKARDGRALALYYMSLLRGKQGRDAEARKLREQAAAYPVSGAGWTQNGLFSYLMADVLAELGEHRRAIPFCERSVQVLVALNNPVAMAEVLL